jgi:hypothetical protein
MPEQLLSTDPAAGLLSTDPAAGLQPPPNEYAGVTPPPATPPPPDSPGMLAELATGAAKGLGQTVTNLGALWHLVPGVSEAVDRFYGVPGLSERAFQEASKVLTPTSPAQTVGKVGEQVAEVLLPASKIATASQAAATRLAPALAPVVGQTAARVLPRAAIEAAGSAGIAAAQGGNPRVAAGLGAAIPVVGAATRAIAPALREQATKQVVQALGPTKERFKSMAEKLAPQMLQRGLRGSREKLVARAATEAETAGQAIDDAIQQYGQRRADITPVVNALEHAKNAFRETNDAGQLVVYEPRAVKQLDKLQRILTDLGPTVPVNKLINVRRTWDTIVSQAGGFQHRAPGAIGIPLKEQSEAWAKREATGAIRELLDAEVPELMAINKEFKFWHDLEEVLTQTMQRTQPQGPGLIRQGAELAGQIVGGQAGSAMGPAGTIGGAAVLGKLTKMATSVFHSPRWKLASAQTKDALASAIVSGNTNRIASALARVGGVEAAKIGSQP